MWRPTRLVSESARVDDPVRREGCLWGEVEGIEAVDSSTLRGPHADGLSANETV